MTLKPVDGCLNESHWYLNAMGEGWFDKNWKPIFNQPAGVNAITMMKQMTAFAPRGFTSAANDESTINLQQGLAAMGLQWFTRAASMDDEKKSRFVGKINWIAPPGGGQRIANDGYAISKVFVEGQGCDLPDDRNGSQSEEHAKGRGAGDAATSFRAWRSGA